MLLVNLLTQTFNESIWRQSKITLNGDDMSITTHTGPSVQCKCWNHSVCHWINTTAQPKMGT
jgi:hypothetical protein